MTKAHPHADLMLQYAQDAAETDTPWERWEWREGNNMPFMECTNNPSWRPVYVYRRKPLTVNGFEVPAPVKEAKETQLLWVADPTHPAWSFSLAYHSAHPSCSALLKRGIMHTTRGAAVTHAKAMLGIDPKGV